jgi:hypothetical protein
LDLNTNQSMDTQRCLVYPNKHNKTEVSKVKLPACTIYYTINI